MFSDPIFISVFNQYYKKSSFSQTGATAQRRLEAESAASK